MERILMAVGRKTVTEQKAPLGDDDLPPVGVNPLQGKLQTASHGCPFDRFP